MYIQYILCAYMSACVLLVLINDIHWYYEHQSLQNITEVEYGNAVCTGKDDISKVGEYIEWDGDFEIFEHGGWGTKTARMINGTGGFIFAPDVSRDHNLTSFITELYRYNVYQGLDSSLLPFSLPFSFVLSPPYLPITHSLPVSLCHVSALLCTFPFPAYLHAMMHSNVPACA